ncbi:MAG: hypothetical protein PVH12_03535 [Candidatus Bathyarchaeota archaeon]|jgi:DNA-binding MarR family transcriptional regulator
MALNTVSQIKEVAEIACRHIKLLEVVYFNQSPPLNISQLAAKTKQDDGNLSRYVSKLEEIGLLVTQARRKRRGGKPEKIVKLSVNGIKLVEALTGIIKETQPPSNWVVDEMLEMITGENLDLKFKAQLASRLANMAIYNAETLLNHERVRQLFQQIATTKSNFDQTVEAHLRTCLLTSISNISQNEDVKEWFLEEIFKPLRENLTGKRNKRDTTQKFRHWTIRIISKAALLLDDQELTKNTIDDLLQLYFKKDTETCELAQEELLKFTKYHEHITGKIKSLLNEPKNRSKTQDLIEAIIIQNLGFEDLRPI